MNTIESRSIRIKLVDGTHQRRGKPKQRDWV